MEDCHDAFLRRAIVSIIRETGFSEASSTALQLLCLIVSQYMKNLYDTIRYFTESTFRDMSSALDVYQCLNYCGLELNGTYKYAVKSRKLKPIPFRKTRRRAQISGDFKIDKFPYTYMTNFFHPKAPAHLPYLPPPHTCNFSPVEKTNHAVDTPEGKEFFEINSRVRDRLIQYISKLVEIKSLSSESIQKDKEDLKIDWEADDAIMNPDKDDSIYPTGSVSLNMDVELHPINYELAYGPGTGHEISWNS